MLLLLRGLCLFAMAPSRLHGQLGLCKQQKLLGGSLALPLQASAREMRFQDAAVEITSLQQAMVYHVFAELHAGCVRQRRLPSTCPKGHHFVRTCTFTLSFGLPGKQQPFFAMFLGYTFRGDGGRACAAARAFPRVMFEHIERRARGSRAARAARTGLPDLAADRLARCSLRRSKSQRCTPPSPPYLPPPPSQITRNKNPPAHAAVTSILAASAKPNPTGTRMTPAHSCCFPGAKSHRHAHGRPRLVIAAHLWSTSHRHAASSTSRHRRWLQFSRHSRRQSRSPRQFSRQHLPLPWRWLQFSRHTHRQSRSSRQFSRQSARSAISPPAALARCAANSVYT